MDNEPIRQLSADQFPGFPGYRESPSLSSSLNFVAGSMIPGYSAISQLNNISSAVASNNYGQALASAASINIPMPSAAAYASDISGSFQNSLLSTLSPSLGFLRQPQTPLFASSLTADMFGGSSGNVLDRARNDLNRDPSYFSGLGLSDKLFNAAERVGDFLFPSAQAEVSYPYGTYGPEFAERSPESVEAVFDRTAAEPVTSPVARMVAEPLAEARDVVGSNESTTLPPVEPKTDQITEKTVESAYALAEVFLPGIEGTIKSKNNLVEKLNQNLQKLQARENLDIKDQVELGSMALKLQTERANLLPDIQLAEQRQRILSDAGATPDMSPREMAERVVDKALVDFGISLPDTASKTQRDLFQYARNQSIRDAESVLRGKSIAEADSLLSGGTTVAGEAKGGGSIYQRFGLYKEGLKAEILNKPEYKGVSFDVDAPLPRGVSPENKESVRNLINQHTKARKEWANAFGNNAPEVSRLDARIATLNDIADGAMPRALARQAIQNPIAKIIESSGENTLLSGYSSAARTAVMGALLRDPLFVGAQQELGNKLEEHRSGAITNAELNAALSAYLNTVRPIAEELNPVISSHWWGDKRVKGADVSFEKLAAVGALTLGLYENTIGKRKDREEEFERLKELERFRTDEALRLYGGRLGMQQQYAGTTELGGPKPVPAGSPTLAAIAQSGLGNPIGGGQ